MPKFTACEMLQANADAVNYCNLQHLKRSKTTKERATLLQKSLRHTVVKKTSALVSHPYFSGKTTLLQMLKNAPCKHLMQYGLLSLSPLLRFSSCYPFGILGVSREGGNIAQRGSIMIVSPYSLPAASKFGIQEQTHTCIHLYAHGLLGLSTLTWMFPNKALINGRIEKVFSLRFCRFWAGSPHHARGP